jgi:hypothetical protein
VLLDVRPQFVLREFVRKPVFFLTCDIPGAITKTDSAGGQRVEVRSFVGCTEIHECTSSDVVSKNIELCGPGEEIEITSLILTAAGVYIGRHCGVEGRSGVH